MTTEVSEFAEGVINALVSNSGLFSQGHFCHVYIAFYTFQGAFQYIIPPPNPVIFILQKRVPMPNEGVSLCLSSHRRLVKK